MCLRGWGRVLFELIVLLLIQVFPAAIATAAATIFTIFTPKPKLLEALAIAKICYLILQISPSRGRTGYNLDL